MLKEYIKCKNKLEEFYDNIAEFIKVRSKIYVRKGEENHQFLSKLSK